MLQKSAPLILQPRKTPLKNHDFHKTKDNWQKMAKERLQKTTRLQKTAKERLQKITRDYIRMLKTTKKFWHSWTIFSTEIISRTNQMVSNIKKFCPRVCSKNDRQILECPSNMLKNVQFLSNQLQWKLGQCWKHFNLEPAILFM